MPVKFLVYDMHSAPFIVFQDFQKEIVRAAESFTAIGHKHIETGKSFDLYG